MITIIRKYNYNNNDLQYRNSNSGNCDNNRYKHSNNSSSGALNAISEFDRSNNSFDYINGGRGAANSVSYSKPK